MGRGWVRPHHSQPWTGLTTAPDSTDHNPVKVPQPTPDRTDPHTWLHWPQHLTALTTASETNDHSTWQNCPWHLTELTIALSSKLTCSPEFSCAQSSTSTSGTRPALPMQAGKSQYCTQRNQISFENSLPACSRDLYQKRFKNEFRLGKHIPRFFGKASRGSVFSAITGTRFRQEFLLSLQILALFYRSLSPLKDTDPLHHSHQTRGLTLVRSSQDSTFSDHFAEILCHKTAGSRVPRMRCQAQAWFFSPQLF